MSPEDNSDAFEELESSSNKSSDLKNSANVNASNGNENASNLNEVDESVSKPTRKRNRSRSPCKVNKPLVFKLDWSTRDEINASLNQYTKLLCVEKAEAELTEDKLTNDNTSLYQALLNLPLKSDADVSAGSRPSKRVTLDLDSSAKLQIISTLVENHNLVVHTESASEESKLEMVEQNNDLICKLAKLPLSITMELADESTLKGDGSQQKAEEDAKDAELVKELNKKITDLAKATAKTEKAEVLGKLVELAELSAEVDLDFNRNEVEFEYELDGVEAFLKSKADRQSEYCFAGGLAWYLSLKPSIEDKEEYLSIHLEAKDYAGGDDWSVRVDFDVSLLTQSGGQNKSNSFTKDLSKEMDSWGWPEFVSVAALRANGYVKDDKLRVRASVKLTNEVIRG